jgi:CheY-like chemotaxis protein
MGTRVELSIPLSLLELAKDPPLVPTASASVRDLVLVAEDNPVNQKLMARTLAKLGYAHQICEDGEDAMRVYRERASQILCVLMDCQMPKMDGYEASVRIRELEHRLHLSRVPIVAVTANAMAQDREKCLQAGMDDHLPKPVRSSDLEAALVRWTHSAA